MFSGNAIETVDKALQSAMIGIHALNVVKPKRIDRSAIQSVFLGKSIISSGTISTENRPGGNMTSDNRVNSVI